MTKYFQPFEGVWCFWTKLGVNIGVRCYLHIFSHILEGVRCYLKIFEAIMCFLGVIEVFVVLGVLLVGSVITNLHIINLILYMIC